MLAIDPCFIRLCGQRFHFRSGVETNSKRRFMGHYGSKWYEIAKDLDVGQCIM